MNSRHLAAIGTGLTTFLVVTAALTSVLAARIAFSAIVALPVGAVAGGVVAVLTWLRFPDDPDSRPALLGGAAIGYTVLGGLLVQYAVPAARGLFDLQGLLGIAGVIGVVVFLAVRRFPERFDG